MRCVHLIPQREISRSWSDVAITSSAVGVDGPGGGHAVRKLRNLLHSSVLYIAADRFGRSTKLAYHDILVRLMETA